MISNNGIKTKLNKATTVRRSTSFFFRCGGFCFGFHRTTSTRVSFFLSREREKKETRTSCNENSIGMRFTEFFFRGRGDCVLIKKNLFRFPLPSFFYLVFDFLSFFFVCGEPNPAGVFVLFSLSFIHSFLFFPFFSFLHFRLLTGFVCFVLLFFLFFAVVRPRRRFSFLSFFF